jgi:PhnB protein
MLAYHDAAGAIEFYRQAFGALELARLTEPDGKISHAEIVVGEARVMIADEYPGYNHTPEELGGSTVVLHLYVPDVDSFVARAVAAGATLLIPVKDQFYGDRAGRIQDPFGYVWIVATHVEDVTVDEMQQRFSAS